MLLALIAIKRWDQTFGSISRSHSLGRGYDPATGMNLEVRTLRQTLGVRARRRELLPLLKLIKSVVGSKCRS